MIALSQSTPPYCHRSLYPNIERAQECVTVAIVVVTGAFVAGASCLFLYEIDAGKFNLRPLSCGAWDLHVRVQIPLLLRHKKLCKKHSEFSYHHGSFAMPLKLRQWRIGDDPATKRPCSIRGETMALQRHGYWVAP